MSLSMRAQLLIASLLTLASPAARGDAASKPSALPPVSEQTDRAAASQGAPSIEEAAKRKSAPLQTGIPAPGPRVQAETTLAQTGTAVPAPKANAESGLAQAGTGAPTLATSTETAPAEAGMTASSLPANVAPPPAQAGTGALAPAANAESTAAQASTGTPAEAAHAEAAPTPPDTTASSFPAHAASTPPQAGTAPPAPSLQAEASPASTLSIGAGAVEPAASPAPKEAAPLTGTGTAASDTAPLAADPAAPTPKNTPANNPPETPPHAGAAPPSVALSVSSRGGEATKPTQAPSEASLPLLSPEEKRKICRQYNGKHITYYGSVYKVIACKRYELSSSELYRTTQAGLQLFEVDNPVIQALELAGTYEDELASKKKPTNPCHKFHRQYIMYAVDVYWVEACTKRPFPDWASYESHRGKLTTGSAHLHSVSWDEFAQLKEGDPMSSVIDEEFRELSDRVDVLPIDEACRGIMGQFVTYFDSIYFIERNPRKGSEDALCHRRSVDGEEYTHSHGHKSFHLKELTSSQALSIPVGEPLVLPARKQDKKVKKS